MEETNEDTKKSDTSLLDEPETRSVHYIRYLRFYYHHWVDTTAGELLVLKGIIPTMFGTDMVY